VSPTAVIGISRTHHPYPRQGVQADSRGIPRYTKLPESLIAMLARHLETGPDVEAVVEVGGQRLAYRQLRDRAARAAGGLRAAGGVAVAVNTRSSQPEVEFVLQDAGVTVDLAAAGPLPDGDPLVIDGLGRSDVAAFFCTSGTTGNPKGVPTTHEAFLANVGNVLTCLGLPADIGAGLRTLIPVPLFHVTGCNSQLLVAARIGGTSVILPAFDQAKMIASIPAERIAFVLTVPAIYSLILRRREFATIDVSAVRWVGYGGAPIAPGLVRALQDAFPGGRVFNGYEMTETASVMSMLPHEDAVEHADSVGYSVPSVDLGIVPLDDDPSTGELVVRGANVTAGYWQRPETNAETIVDGWLRTGDIVRADDAGRVHIVDRIKDIIIRGGENVSSIEVEAALLAAPGVAEAAVIAVPDDVMGEKVGAVLFGGAETVDVPQVLAHCRKQLADFKIPQYVVVAGGPLPRNPGGKLLKAQLRESVEWGAPL
jgi:acyl-CoA synthetase (AMP-forming)/AMP-acid ligase II